MRDPDEFLAAVDGLERVEGGEVDAEAVVVAEADQVAGENHVRKVGQLELLLKAARNVLSSRFCDRFVLLLLFAYFSSWSLFKMWLLAVRIVQEFHR